MQIKKQNKSNVFLWPMIFAVVIIILSVNAGLAINTLQDLSRVQRNLTNTDTIMVKLKDLHVTVLSAESGQRGYLITDNEDYLVPYEESLNQLSSQLEKVRKVESEIDGQQAHIDRLLRLVDLKIKELRETVELTKEKRSLEARGLILTNRGRNLYREIRDIFETIEKKEFAQHESLLDQLKNNRKEATFVFIISGVVSIMLVVGMVALALISIRRDRKYQERLEDINTHLQQKVKERTEELEVYSEELARSNRELEDFAFVASHDLQEPLRKIQAFGERLESQFEAQMPTTAKDYLMRMRNAAQRMSDLINDLLQYSRVTTKAKPFTQVNLNDIADEILDILEVSIEENEATIKFDELPVIQGDGSQMMQLMLNLIGNAIKFHRPGVAPQITVTHGLVDEHSSIGSETVKMHEIKVTDNGIGFDPQFADKIFVPFQRLHGRNEYKGTGIGLALCRKIVEHHGGSIHATSEPGKGTSICLTLPHSE